MHEVEDKFEKWFNCDKARKNSTGKEFRELLTGCANRACEMMRRESKKKKPAKKKSVAK